MPATSTPARRNLTSCVEEAIKAELMKPDAIIHLEPGMNVQPVHPHPPFGGHPSVSPPQPQIYPNGIVTFDSTGNLPEARVEVKEIVRDEVETPSTRKWNPEKWQKEEKQEKRKHPVLKALFWASQAAMFGVAVWQLWRWGL